MNRYETTFTLTVSTKAEDEQHAEWDFERAQIYLLEWTGLKPVKITYLEPSEAIDCMT